jgi:N6-L-threonylcarbamoyladenine synthase
MIKTLAIETSCDDTSIGIVTYEDGFWACPILKTYSQITEHQEFGGVVPELAYRLHEEKIIWLLEEVGYNEIMSCDCITVTREPGLPWSLVVWNTVASFLAALYHKPIYRVNHIHGHVLSLLLDRKDEDCPIPWLVLTVSGGHNEIYFIDKLENLENLEKLDESEMKVGWNEVKGQRWTIVNTWEDTKVKDRDTLQTLQTLSTLNIMRVWHSLDDAAGESFDKVARMLGGAHPWGPWIEQQAKHGTSRPDIKFKRILLDGKWTWQSQATIDANHLNFSFSGMKSQVYNYLQKHPRETLSDQDVADVCLEFSECVSDILVEKIIWATQKYECKTVGLVGWVSANDRLYEKLTQKLSGISCLRPVKKVYSTDNAAMIGVVGILNHKSQSVNHNI